MLRYEIISRSQDVAIDTYLFPGRDQSESIPQNIFKQALLTSSSFPWKLITLTVAY